MEKKKTNSVKTKKLSEIYNILPIDFFAAAYMDEKKLNDHLKNIKKCNHSN